MFIRQFGRGGNMRRGFMFFLVVMFLAAGCGNVFEGMEDKDTEEAKQLEVSQHLDKGDYQWVVDHPELAGAIDYAAAAMGLAGLTPTNLIQGLNNSTSDSGDLSAVISLALNTDALHYLQTANDGLTTALASNPDDPELNFQATLTALASTIVAMAQVGDNHAASIEGGFDSSDGISSSEATALGVFIAAHPTVMVDTDGDGIADSELAGLVNADVVTISASLPGAQLGEGSDLNNVLTEATQGAGSINYDGVGNVTAQDISDYLRNTLGMQQ